jgi:glutathione synthase/RimK-type ligase-like ATP-grasp enzyme
MPNKEVSFLAKHANLRLVKDASYKQVVNGTVLHTKSVAAQFTDGEYHTSDPEMIEWLRNHHSYGLVFFENKDQMAESENKVEETVKPDKPVVVMPKKVMKKGPRTSVPTTADQVEDES